ncbi:hypothetical protein FDECE_3952 [Fusarium decemcellulare]|nr:hypothetical protein FDECE_3952 [Fusarium decemcellulare]
MPVSRTLIYTALAVFVKIALSTGSPTPGNFSLASIEWTKCDMPVSQIPLGTPVPDSVDCGRLTVPLDHYNPSYGNIELGMMRLKAKNPDCKQNLFYNSSGPGMPSSILVGKQALWEAGKLEGTRPPGFSADLRASFNIIGLDLRGEGLSSPISCDKDIFNDVVSNIALDDAGFDKLVKHNKALGESCSRMTGPLFSKMGTDQRIRDIELVRQASGSPVLNWVGWSGGSQIGVEYAELYPDKVGRLAIDGINTRDLSAATSIISEAVSFDGELDYFFNWCNSTAECALHGRDVASIFDELADAAEEKGLSAPTCVGDKTCGSDVRIEDLLQQVMAFLEGGHSMPTPHSYYTLAEALAEAHSTGNATMFARKVAQSNTGIQEIFFPHINVLCSDYTRDHLRSAADLRSIFTPARVLAPRSRGINVMQHGRTFCLGWPFNTTDVPHRLNPESMKRLPPVLIVNGLHDSATATNWAAEMRDDVPTGINVWRSTGGHTSYKHMGDTSKAMDAFLINGTLPWDGTRFGISEVIDQISHPPACRGIFLFFRPSTSSYIYYVNSVSAYQALYQDALRRGRRLVAELKHGSQLPAGYQGYQGEQHDAANLRAENVDTNRMVWSAVVVGPELILGGGRADSDSNTDEQEPKLLQVVFSNEENISLPKSAGTRAVHFYPSPNDVVETNKAATVQAKSSSKHKWGKDEGGKVVGNIVISPEDILFPGDHPYVGPPQVIQQTANEFVSWKRLRDDNSAGTQEEDAEARRGGQLEARYKRFDRQEDCDNVPYLRW